MLNRIEAYQEYRRKIMLLNKEENYYHRKSTVSAWEIYKMNEKRRELFDHILKPLYDALKKDMDVKRVYFSDGDGENIFINIEYSDGNKDGFIILNNSEFDENLDIVLDTSNGAYNALLDKNQKLLSSVYSVALDNDADRDCTINSTSHLFSLHIDLYKYLLSSRNKHNNHYVKIIHEYLIDDVLKGLSSYNDINLLLQDREILEKYLRNIKFYEESIPKYLIKKR